jgi:glutamyl-Q tRNA(Asp) synthetase
MTSPPVFRFAPSPNGHLHLGHAASALWNEKLAREAGGRLLVRIEDIDIQRCTQALSEAALHDLDWLGIAYEHPVLFQHTRVSAYREALQKLDALGLLYRCTCTRKDAQSWPRDKQDPEGQPLYPGTCRHNPGRHAGDAALRLKMDEALHRGSQARDGQALTWPEKGLAVLADAAQWGDVVVARKDIGTSYHLAVVVDDAFQGVTDVVRGMDLYQATAIHRVLQVLLDFPEPHYHHHPLVTDVEGRKLSKSAGDTSLENLRNEGLTPEQIRQQLGFVRA